MREEGKKEEQKEITVRKKASEKGIGKKEKINSKVENKIKRQRKVENSESKEVSCAYKTYLSNCAVQKTAKYKTF